MTLDAAECLAIAQEHMVHMRGAMRTYLAGAAGVVVALAAGVWWFVTHQSGAAPIRGAQIPARSDTMIPLALAVLTAVIIPLVNRYWKARKLTWRCSTHIDRLNRATGRGEPHAELHGQCERLEEATQDV